jgi:hypothetical protein
VPVTKQANNFNGPPGNELTLDAQNSLLSTTVTGSCLLRFVSTAQPANARVSQAITAQAYTPTGPPVQVEVVDSSGNRIPVSGLQVNVAIGRNAGGGTLSGATGANTSSGVASFSTLAIDKPGAGYTLVASSSSTPSTTSTAFNIDEVALFCEEDVNCTGTLSLTNTNALIGGTSTSSITAIQGPTPDIDAGFLTISRVGGPLECIGYTDLLAKKDVIDVDYSALDREKVETAQIDKKVMNSQTNNGAAFLQSCFGAPYTFATRPGTPLEVNAAYVPGPYPAPEYKGLLPDCGGSAVLDDPNTPGVQGTTITNAGPPCVEKRNKTASGDGVIVSRLPSGRAVGGDPRITH